ncbi:MAG: hypothetical protein ABI607_03020 [Betaproteobacteria bacterium]
MPIVTIEVVAPADSAAVPGLAQLLADAVGLVINSPPGQTWVRVRAVPLAQYAENLTTPDPANLPVFVTILKRHPPQGAELELEVTALTRAVAKVIVRPSHCVHIEYAPAALGRLSFGGTLVQ